MMEAWFVSTDDLMQQPTVEVASPEVQVTPPVVQGVAVPELKSMSCHKGTRRGRKKGSGANLQMTYAEWYSACETFKSLKVKMKAAEFLQSD
mmetsp:Transcript_9845/g.15139  ORF Transcript_9845/g.15139 Transcript_9845/m.15139 type:complete len:92 (-) Transcript_9845:191-466(-)